MQFVRPSGLAVLDIRSIASPAVGMIPGVEAVNLQCFRGGAVWRMIRRILQLQGPRVVFRYSFLLALLLKECLVTWSGVQPPGPLFQTPCAVDLDRCIELSIFKLCQRYFPGCTWTCIQQYQQVFGLSPLGLVRFAKGGGRIRAVGAKRHLRRPSLSCRSQTRKKDVWRWAVCRTLSLSWI
jgi:hypothetical protein